MAETAERCSTRRRRSSTSRRRRAKRLISTCLPTTSHPPASTASSSRSSSTGRPTSTSAPDSLELNPSSPQTRSLSARSPREAETIKLEYFLDYSSGTSAKPGAGFGFAYDLATAPVAPAYADFAARPLTAGIPEPSTWAMMLIGFSGLGFAAFRGNGRRESHGLGGRAVMPACQAV
jgi:hypothetical protein